MHGLTSVIGATLVGAVIAGGAAQAVAQQYKWDMPNAFSARAGDGIADKALADLVAEKSGGRIKIVNHFNGSLGYRGVDHLDAVRDGAVPIARHDLTPYGGHDPIFLLSTQPFLVRTQADLETLAKLYQPYLEKAFLKYNQVIIAIGLFPPSGIWTAEPINSVASIKGVKIRAPDLNSLNTLIDAGASAVSMPFSDVIPGLSTGSIKGVLTSADTGVSSNLTDHLKHFLEINWAVPMTAVTINRGVWDTLPDDLKTVLKDAGAQITQRTIEGMTKRVKDNYAEMRSKGVTINTNPPQDLMEALRAGGQKVTADWRQKAGPSAAVLDAYLAAVKR